MDGIQDTGLASISFRDFKPDVQINSDSGLYLPAKPALILANDEEPLLSWHPLDKFGAVSPTVVKPPSPKPPTTIVWPNETVAALCEFYGDPRGRNGKSNPAWESANLVDWVPPYPMYYSWALHDQIKSMHIHKRALPAFDAAFKEVLAVLGYEYIVAHHLNITGGAFCFRVERGGSRLSVHSWAAAIDMDPQHNPFPHKWIANMGFLDLQFVAILKKHGFYWRGDRIHGDNDPMHLQLCSHVY